MADAFLTSPPWRDDVIKTALAWDHDYFRRAEAKVFWAIVANYAQQNTRASCSLATASVILNALDWLTSDTPGRLWSERRLLKKVDDKHWEEATRDGCIGLSLDDFSAKLQRILTLADRPWRVRTVSCQDNPKLGESFREQLRRMENQADCLVVANFQFDALYQNGDPDGHFCPIGAYDEARNRVLMMDVYYDYPPTWVDFDRLVAAMQGQEHELLAYFGFAVLEKL